MKNIDNAATNKISPFKKLTTEQEQLVNDIISFTKHHLTQNHPAIYTLRRCWDWKKRNLITIIRSHSKRSADTTKFRSLSY